MAAVLRIKRRSDEEPLDALVFACKKKKLNDTESSVLTDNPITVVKFAATVKSQKDDIGVLLPVSEKEDIWHSKLRHKVDLQKRLRQKRKELTENSRYKVVNCFRHLDSKDDDTTESTENRNVIIFEVESSVQDDKKVQESSDNEDDIQYVYDIYYGYTNKEYDFASLDHLIDIMPFSESLDFGPSNDVSDSESLNAPEDEDSNEENNWRNDYPDSDNSINEDDMRLAMQMGDMNLGHENELSSSDEDLVFGRDADPQDVEHYGELYAKYKARVQRELNDYEESSEEDSSVDEKLRGDSDDEDPELRFM